MNTAKYSKTILCNSIMRNKKVFGLWMGQNVYLCTLTFAAAYVWLNIYGLS